MELGELADEVLTVDEWGLRVVGFDQVGLRGEGDGLGEDFGGAPVDELRGADDAASDDVVGLVLAFFVIAQEAEIGVLGQVDYGDLSLVGD